MATSHRQQSRANIHRMRADGTSDIDLTGSISASCSPSVSSSVCFGQRPRHHQRSSITSPIDSRGAIRKSIAHHNSTAFSSLNGNDVVTAVALSRARSSSSHSSHADRLFQLALDLNPSGQSGVSQSIAPPPPPTSAGLRWITPLPSPQNRNYSSADLDPFPEWTVPTPPRSDSGVPPVCVDTSDDAVTSAIVASPELAFDDEPAVSSEMSSLGFLLPTHYGSGVLDPEPGNYSMDGNFIPPVRNSSAHMSSALSSATHTVSSSPALYGRRMTPASSTDGVSRASDLPGLTHADSGYGQDFRRPTNPYGSPISAGDYSVTPGQTVRSMSGPNQSPLPSPPIGTMGASMVSQYHTGMPRSSTQNMYDTSIYASSYTSAPSSMGISQAHHPHPMHSPQSVQHQHQQAFTTQHGMGYSPTFPNGSMADVLGAGKLNGSSSIRVLNQTRPKPQCWDHGCNGRQFSTFSNLLRHQREKSGTAAKSYCPKCGAEFTRTTARNGHLNHDKCTKNGVRRSSDGK